LKKGQGAQKLQKCGGAAHKVDEKLQPIKGEKL
jgi:hypothetical protein